jgi:hypothetical protein
MTRGDAQRSGRGLVWATLLLAGSVACGASGSTPVSAASPPAAAASPASETGGPVCRVAGEAVEYAGADGRPVRRTDFARDGATPIDIRCLPGVVFVLTTTELHTVFLEAEEETDGPISISLAGITTDMRSFFDAGLVTWAASPDGTCFLTADGFLTMLPLHQLGDTVPAYHLRFDVRGAKMIWYETLIFIATSAGDLVIMSFDPDGSAPRRTLPLPRAGEGADFFVHGGRLFYGRPGGPGVAIVPHGASPEAVELREVR